MDINMKILLPLVIVQFLLAVIALVDLYRRDASRIRGGKKLPWVVLVIIIGTLGPIIYFFAGRKE